MAPLFEGHLQKRGGYIRTWKRRYFELTAETLSYSVNEFSRGTIRTFPASNIQTAARVFFLCAESEAQAEDFQVAVSLAAASNSGGDATAARHALAQLQALIESSVPIACRFSEKAAFAEHLSAVRRDFENLEEIGSLVAHLLDFHEFPPHPEATRAWPSNPGTPAPAQPGSNAPQCRSSEDPPAPPALAPVPEQHHVQSTASEPSQVSQQPALGHGRTATEAARIAVNDVIKKVDTAWRIIDKQVAEAEKATPVVSSVSQVASQSVRVFVSSTFADMFSEREVLVRKVFPRLRAWAEPRGITIIECDLRWGVPKESTSETVFRTCLGELDNCIETNTNPFFINLLGERYGWIPTEAEVPDAVFNTYGWVRDVSITHMEILHGAWRQGNPNAIFCLRNADVIPAIPEKFRGQFQDTERLAVSQLRRLKTEVEKRFGPTQQVAHYSAKVAGTDDSTGLEKVKLDLEAFEDTIYQFLVAAIERQYPVMDASENSALMSLSLLHERFLAREALDCGGRESELDAILTSLKSEGQPGMRPMLWQGARGVGKSALLAEAARRARSEGMTVVFHSPNAGPNCGAAADLFVRIILQYQALQGEEELSERHSNTEILAKLFEQDVTMFTPVIDAIRECLERRADGPRFVIIVDDVESATGAHITLKFLRSILGDCGRRYRVIYAAGPALANDAEEAMRYEICNVAPLAREKRSDLIVNTLGRFNKRLDEEQLGLLLDNPGAEDLNWILTACEELRVFGVFEAVTKRIKELATDLSGLCEQIWDRIKEEDDSGVLLRAASVLALSPRGLYETEVRDILGTGTQLEDGSWEYEPVLAAHWLLQLQRMRPLLKSNWDILAFRDHHVSAYICIQLSKEHVKETLTFMAEFFERKSREDRRWLILPDLVIKLHDMDRARALYQEPGFITTCPAFVRRKVAQMLRCQAALMSTGVYKPVQGFRCQRCYTFGHNNGPKNFCTVCKGHVSTRPNFTGPVTLFMTEDFAYFCDKHAALAAVHQKMMRKCQDCKNPLPLQGHATPMIVCMECKGLGRLVCCGMR